MYARDLNSAEVCTSAAAPKIFSVFLGAELLAPLGMSYEQARSESSTAVLDTYVSWQHPFRDIQIFVHPQLVQTLATHALNSAQQGSEIGGVLWGKVGPNDSVIVADATLVPNAGPFFNATPADSRNLQQALNSRAPNASLSLAGYFRSSIRQGLSLTPQDQSVIRHTVTDPDAVFIVIKPGHRGVCTAGLSFWHDGRLETDPGYLEIPFISGDQPATHSELEAAASYSIPNPPEAFWHAEEHTPAPARVAHNGIEEPSIVAILRESALRNNPSQAAAARAAQQQNPEVEQTAQKKPLVFVALALVAVSFLGLVTMSAIYFGLPLVDEWLHGTPAPPPKLGLDLQFTRLPDGQLSLNWNRDDPEITNTSNAVLTVTDGHRSTKLDLDNAQLRSGKLLFVPKTENVQFRLDLNTDQLHTVSETVRALPATSEAARKKRVHTGGELMQGNGISAPAGWTVTAEVIESDVIPAAPNDAAPPAPTPQIATPQGTDPATLAAASGSAVYVPPQVLEEMMPQATPLGQFAHIPVQVTIDPTGHVTAAHALKEGGTENSELATIATEAAQQWRFKPASLNGTPVASEYKIIFAFHRQLP